MQIMNTKKIPDSADYQDINLLL